VLLGNRYGCAEVDGDRLTLISISGEYESKFEWNGEDFIARSEYEWNGKDYVSRFPFR
jgi:hypothetical protein